MPGKNTVGLRLASSIAFGSAVLGQDVPANDTDAYVPAKVIRRANPEYPQIALTSEKGGWVTVNFIISQSGEVLEPVVERSVGNLPLERAALAAIRNWRYDPATLNGQPVEQAASTTLTFWVDTEERDPTNVARPVFQRRYQALVESLESGDLDRAQRRIDELESMDRANPYEDAWFWFANYYFLEATNSPDVDERFRSLQLAVEREQDYLEPNLLVPAAQRLYALYAQRLDLSSAVRIYVRLRDSAIAQNADIYAATLAAMTPSYQRILAAISGEQMFLLNAEINERGYWIHGLLRRSFSLGDVRGGVESVQIRCERGIQRYTAINEESVWHAPTDRGACSVFITGRPDTTFVFEEYPLNFGRGTAAK